MTASRRLAPNPSAAMEWGTRLSIAIVWAPVRRRSYSFTNAGWDRLASLCRFRSRQPSLSLPLEAKSGIGSHRGPFSITLRSTAPPPCSATPSVVPSSVSITEIRGSPRSRIATIGPQRPISPWINSICETEVFFGKIGKPIKVLFHCIRCARNIQIFFEHKFWINSMS